MEGEKPFRFAVEKAYFLRGRGTVVTGKVDEGSVSLRTPIGFMGVDGRWVRGIVTGIEVSQNLVEEAQAGQQASLLLSGIKKGQLSPGAVLMNLPQSAAVPAEYGMEIPEPELGAPSIPSSQKPIHPTSGIARIVFFLLIGILIVLALFYLQQK